MPATDGRLLVVRHCETCSMSVANVRLLGVHRYVPAHPTSVTDVCLRVRH